MEARRIAMPGDRSLLIRTIEHDDAAGISSLYHRLDDDDLYKRFFSGRPPPEAFIQKMTSRADGRFGVVADLIVPGQPPCLVAEASFAMLPDGNAEVGITVDPSVRGWLGPYLLDVLVQEAARRSIPNLEAEVLVTNRPMQALLESRGSAVMEHSDRPATVRLCIGTARRAPSWSEAHDRPRLLVEVRGGRWRTTEAVRRAGFEVLACPGVYRKLTRCPALAGAPCPLASTADVIVDGIRDEAGQALIEAHRRLHPGVPVCVLAIAFRQPGAEEPAQPPPDVAQVYDDMDDGEVVELLRSLITR